MPFAIPIDELLVGQRHNLARASILVERSAFYIPADRCRRVFTREHVHDAVGFDQVAVPRALPVAEQLLFDRRVGHLVACNRREVAEEEQH